MVSDLLRVVRWLLRRPQGLISRDRAIRLACEEFDRRGWPYDRPEAIERLNEWEVWMERDLKRGPVAVVNVNSGEVVYAGRSSLR